MVWFRENWYEEVSRQLRQGLAKCLAIAFENRGAVSEATITPHTLNFVKKLVSTFGIGIGRRLQATHFMHRALRTAELGERGAKE
jgi:transformation/transcription domain-associated protein